MIRRLFDLLALLSLLLFLGGLYLWVWRVYGPTARPFYVNRQLGSQILYVFPQSNALRIHYIPTTPTVVVYTAGETRHFAGFWYESHSTPNARITAVALPAWFLLLLTAIGPVLWLRRRLRTGRQYPVGHCARCGYDLRATPTRCPECGSESNAEVRSAV